MLFGREGFDIAFISRHLTVSKSSDAVFMRINDNVFPFCKYQSEYISP